MNKYVEFKGTSNGLVLSIKPFESFEQILEGVKEKLDASAQFFQGAKIIGVEGFLGEEKQRVALYHLLTDEYNLEVLSLDPLMRMTKSEEVPSEVIEEEEEITEIDYKHVDYNEFDTKIVRHTLRSGMGVAYDGNIVVIGDVNPGAELSAGGNIIVMGKLRGMVHAGKFGNKNAYVIASKMLPTQIRITNVIARAPEGENIDELKPEIAHLKSGKMSIEEL
ncbi:MAG: septum site-determining protein MinC [Clostridia bacterium]|nr:septum site-determining protein MinC [Clostridia bacterium]